MIAIDYTLVAAAKWIAASSAAVAVAGMCFVAYEAWRVARHHVQSPTKKAATYTGAVTSLAVLGFIVFATLTYVDGQQDRKNLLAELKGISADIDRRVENSTHERVSYLHTHDIVRQAIAACEEMQSGEPSRSLPNGCVKLGNEH